MVWVWSTRSSSGFLSAATTVPSGIVLKATAAATPAVPAPVTFRKSLRLSSTSATPPFCLPWRVEYLAKSKGQADIRLLAPLAPFVRCGTQLLPGSPTTPHQHHRTLEH